MFKHVTLTDKDPGAPMHTRNPFDENPKRKKYNSASEQQSAAGPQQNPQPAPRKNDDSKSGKTPRFSLANASEASRWFLVVAAVLVGGGLWYGWTSGAAHRQVKAEYDAAAELLASGRLQAARVEVDTFMTKHAQSKWADDALWGLGQAALAGGEPVLARNSFQRLVEGYPDSPYIEPALEQLLELADVKAEPRAATRFAEPIEIQEYTVRSGDTLGGIARRFGTTVSAINKANNLEGHMIFPGQVLKIVPSQD